jgi:hypothetical protein
MAAQGIGRIGGIDDHRAIANQLHSAFNEPCLRIFWVNLEKLAHTASELVVAEIIERLG